jgi:hypothetical protein
MKGMHGVTLHPDSSVLEPKVRLYNRAEERQSFLWWANAAVRVNDDYQAFFPTDVDHVFDHAKRAAAAGRDGWCRGHLRSRGSSPSARVGTCLAAVGRGSAAARRERCCSGMVARLVGTGCGRRRAQHAATRSLLSLA